MYPPRRSGGRERKNPTAYLMSKRSVKRGLGEHYLELTFETFRMIPYQYQPVKTFIENLFYIQEIRWREQTGDM